MAESCVTYAGLFRVKLGVLIHKMEAKSLLVWLELLVNCFLKAVEGASHY